MDNFSDKLIRLRKKNNYSMKEAAKLLDVPYTTYVGWEKGKTPNLEMLNKIATAFSVEIPYFFKKDSKSGKVYERYRKIGSLVKYYREQKHMSQKELGEKVFLSDYLIDNIEKGISMAGYTFKLAQIANGLDIPFVNLIKDEDGNILIRLGQHILLYALSFKETGYSVKTLKGKEEYTNIENAMDAKDIKGEDLLLITNKNNTMGFLISAIEFIEIMQPLLTSASKISRKIYDELVSTNIKASMNTLMLLNKKEPK